MQCYLNFYIQSMDELIDLDEDKKENTFNIYNILNKKSTIEKSNKMIKKACNYAIKNNELVFLKKIYVYMKRYEKVTV